MSIRLAGWRKGGEELFLSDENSRADENRWNPSYLTRSKKCRMLRSVVSESLAHHEVLERLHEWLGTVSDLHRLTAVNDALERQWTAADFVASLLPAEQQKMAAFAHNTEIGRLAYAVWTPGASAAVSEPSAVRALLRCTRNSLLWRLATQNLFAPITAACFEQLSTEWPDGGDLSLSNVQEQSGAGGSFEIFLPAAVAAQAAAGVSDSAVETVDAPAEPVDGGLLIGQCTFQIMSQQLDGERLQLAVMPCVVVVDLDRHTVCQHVTGCTPTAGLLHSCALRSAALAIGLRQQHLARPAKSGWLLKRHQLLPLWRPRFFVLHYGTLRYWPTPPSFGSFGGDEWSEDELRAHTSIDVVQLAGGALRVANVQDDCVTGGASGTPSTATTLPIAELAVRVQGGGTQQPAATYELELETPHSRYAKCWLRAASAEEQAQWADALRQHIWRGPPS